MDQTQGDQSNPLDKNQSKPVSELQVAKHQLFFALKMPGVLIIYGLFLEISHPFESIAAILEAVGYILGPVFSYIDGSGFWSQFYFSY